MGMLTALPTHFDGRPILERLPYTMPGELVVPASTNQRPFQTGTFTYNADLVIELTHACFQVSVLDESFVPIATPAAVQDTLRMVRCRAKGAGKTRDLMQATQLLSSLAQANRLVDNGTWYFSSPHYLINGQGWTVEIDNQISTGAINVAWSFEGSQLVLGQRGQ